MKKNNRAFAVVDALYICMMILPIVAAIVLKVLTTPQSNGITITGAQIYATIPMPIQDLKITASQINSWLVMISIIGLCLYITHGLKTKNISKRQHVAEWAVEKTENLVRDGMGEYFMGFSSFIAAVLALSAFSSLLSLFGLFPPTSDINVVAGWAILVFFLITYYKFKCGPVNYLKSFAQPVALTPLNVISEIATPISMAFRHYGNVLSGTVISVLLGSALAGLSSMLLGSLPGFLADIPLFQMGIPAVLSIYFDVFSGCLQAFIFAMLTMMYVGGAFDLETYKQKKAQKSAKNKQ